MGTKIKCIRCGKEASYIYFGSSYCEKCFKEKVEEVIRAYEKAGLIARVTPVANKKKKEK